VNRDGSPGVVAVLAELDPTRDNLDSTVYDEVVWVTSPDLARDNTIIRFDVAGDDGTATIGTATDVGPIVNSSQINVIARVW